MEVRALTFDVFGTLVDWRSGITEAFWQSGLEGDPRELADDWRARLWPITGEVNRGRRPWRTFDELHQATLDGLLAARGLELSSEGRSGLVRAWHELDAWPDVRLGLEALRRQRIVAALSNAHVALLVDLARHADVRGPFMDDREGSSPSCVCFSASITSLRCIRDPEASVVGVCGLGAPA